MDFLAQLRETVRVVPEEAYLHLKTAALARIEQRDPDDWPKETRWPSGARESSEPANVSTPTES